MAAKVPNLPAEFIQTIRNTFGADGERWLDSFPKLLEEACRRWDLTEIQPVPNLSYNFVAVAQSGASGSERSVALSPSKGRSASHTIRPSTTPQRARGSAQDQVILKLGVPHRELTSEIAALRFYDGRGVCRLLDADADKGMLLLERLQPGHMLATLEDDDRATEIAAEVIQNLWKSSNDCPGNDRRGSRFRTTEVVTTVTTSFIQLKDWFDGFQRLRGQFSGGTGPLPKGSVEAAEALSREFLSENKDEALLHGDFHHYNVLESTRGWLAIDPKGVIGPRGYDLGPFLFNPIDRFLSQGNPKVRTERRIAILFEMLGIERERIRAWAFCHAMLSAWWCIEGNDPSGIEYSLRCADVFRQVRVSAGSTRRISSTIDQENDSRQDRTDPHDDAENLGAEAQSGQAGQDQIDC